MIIFLSSAIFDHSVKSLPTETKNPEKIGFLFRGDPHWPAPARLRQLRACLQNGLTALPNNNGRNHDF
jgi:hypothetical protein